MSIACIFPGQGSQSKGMGAELFDRFHDWVGDADRILGYSLRELCLSDPRGELGQTAFTQPALFVVNAMMYRARQEGAHRRRPSSRDTAWASSTRCWRLACSTSERASISCASAGP